MTSKQDPVKYKGSGTHWKNHIKKYGAGFVETLWYSLFSDQESLSTFSLMFSKQENIVESNCWLNLKYEDGIANGTPGHSTETRKNMSVLHANVKGEHNPMFGRLGVDNPNYGKKSSVEAKKRIKDSWSNKRRGEMSEKFKGIGLKEDHKEKIRLAKLNEEKIHCACCDRYIQKSGWSRHIGGAPHSKQLINSNNNKFIDGAV